jgi:hypothetical protein
MKQALRRKTAMNTYIICFNSDDNDFGLYGIGYRNDFGTALIFRGTLEEVLEIRKDF